MVSGGSQQLGSALFFGPMSPPLLQDAGHSLVREAVCALSKVQNQNSIALVDGESMEGVFDAE